MEEKATYQIRVLPPDSCMILDFNPKRKCEQGIVYTIYQDVFGVADVRFRIRERARNLVERWTRFGGKTLAVIYMADNQQTCLYFGRLVVKEQHYPNWHIQPILTLVRCVGTNVSKKHFNKVSQYILSHYEDISSLGLDDVMEVKL